jgi:iron complex transport system substrate-binding protein
MKRLRSAGLVAALLVASMLVSVEARNARRTTHDAPRTTQAAESAPHRIISLVPAVTEMLFAIGAGNDVIAVSSFDHFPPAVESKPSVGALVDPDFEKILSLKPDLVIVYGTQSDLTARLGRVNIPFFSYVDEGVADIAAAIERLGTRIGRAEDGRREATRIRRELDDIRKAVAGRPRPKTALLFGRELGSLRGIFASGGVGFMHDLLDIAGGTDAFADVRQKSLQATTEILLARAPAVIIEVYPAAGWTPARIAGEINVWKQLPTLPAVRANQVHILADDVLVIPGPRVTAAARLMAKTLHPEAFRE